MNTSTSVSSYKDELIRISELESGSIRSSVADEALKHSDEDLIYFFQDLARYGCISGMVSSLIYYNDTHAFYDEYYDEIEVLRRSFEESTGEPLSIGSDYKNFMAWFAFEETAYELANELGLEI